MKKNNFKKNNNSSANTSQFFFSGNGKTGNGNQNSFFGGQGANNSSVGFFTPNPIIQRKSMKETDEQTQDDGTSLAATKKNIRKLVANPTGNTINQINDAIRNCIDHQALANDKMVMISLRSISGHYHQLWKFQLLMQYGNEYNYPSTIKKLLKATTNGINKPAIFAALQHIDKRTHNTLGFKKFLETTLGGNELERALDLINTSGDTIKGNTYGSQKDGEKKLVANKKNLPKLIDARFKGASSERLKNAMIILCSSPSKKALAQALASIESIRGLAAGSALAQYNKAMALQKAGIAYYKKRKKAAGKAYDHKKDNPSPALDTSKHQSFMGSSAQLRFGKIVGDVFGIDAVFGSLMNPTGGMAGPGNKRIPFIDNGSAVATHGAIHDAAGYLYNCHGIGPGYDYFKTEPGADPSNPLAGQTHAKWWIKEFKNRNKDVGEVEKNLSEKTHIAAAFSKKYEKLNMAQKRNALKIISTANLAILLLSGLSNKDRVAKIKELMTSCNDSEKTEMANYFYKNEGFNTANIETIALMKYYVSRKVRNKSNVHYTTRYSLTTPTP